VPLTTGAAAAQQPGAPPPEVAVEGTVRKPAHFSLEALRALPSVEEEEVAFESRTGEQRVRFTGVPLWALLEQAGGIDDPQRRAVARHAYQRNAN
jgi:DMSO/TMAO reductase YedYZ molybdopterin-dependent catalytic subunit